MKRVLLSALAAALLCSASVSAGHAQTNTSGASNINRSGAPVNVDRIIRAFTQKETEFRKALNEYEFKRDAVIQTIGWGGQISGEYHRTSRFVFDDSGKRYEKILFFPMPTVAGLEITPQDIEDLSGVQTFALEASKINDYAFSYAGTEKLDELNTYVFDVAPKVVPKKESERFFQGRIWVDQQDLQIVKTRGKGVPEGKQRFPTFETYREQIDGKYWFPTYTYADDNLEFPHGEVVHIRMKVRYTDYKRFKGTVRVIEEGDPGDVPPDAKPKP